jgi:hypothetical protein
MIFLVVGTSYVGLYLALALFLLVYLKALARQSWLVTVVAALAAPLAVYLIFELALGVSMPKGVTAQLFA